MGLHTGEGELDADGRLRRPRRPPRGACRRGRPRRPGAALRGDRVAGRRPARAGPVAPVARRPPAQGPAAGTDRAARDRRPARRTSRRSARSTRGPTTCRWSCRRSSGGSASSTRLRALLATTRLVTLTGPGGTGKTRLALQVAASLADEFPDGAWFVPLGGVVGHGRSSVPAIARAMGIGDDPSRSPIDVLGDGARRRSEALLVLDNLEQVRGAGRRPRRAAAPRGPKIRVLATSRAPLRISGEQEYPVPGLPSPVRPRPARAATSASSCPAALRRARPRRRWLAFESVRLFVARGRRGQAGIRDHRRQRGRRRRDRRPPGRRAAGHRARRRADPVPHAGRDPRAARGPARPAGRWRSRRPGAPAVAARRDHVEPRAARRARLRACSSAWPCSWAASTSPAPRRSPARPRTSARTCSTAWRRSSTRASSRSGEVRTASRGSRCSSRSASTRWSAWRRRATPTRRRAARHAQAYLALAEELAPELNGERPAGRARPSRARAREPARRHRLGRRARRRRGRARDHRSRSGGSGRSAATCARRGRW